MILRKSFPYCVIHSNFTSVESTLSSIQISSCKIFCSNNYSFKCLWHCTKKMKFSIEDFFSKCDKIRSFLRIWSHLLKKSLMENFISVQCELFFTLNKSPLINFFSCRMISKCFSLKLRKIWKRLKYKSKNCISHFVIWASCYTNNNGLTHQMPVLLSYRNQSIDLHSKSVDWFLDEGNISFMLISFRLIKKADCKLILVYLLPRKFYVRRNNNKYDSIETRRIEIAHLLPWSDLENCMYTNDKILSWLLNS